MVLRGSLYSKVLEMNTGVSVVTPADYSRGAPYKVVYLFHGMGGNSDVWLDYSRLPVYVDTYRVAVVMPEVGRSFYTDTQYGQRFFTYVSRELPQICETVFNLSAKQEDTATMGASMGGYGALKCALSYPERFGCCCTISSGSLSLKRIFDELRDPVMSRQLALEWGEQVIHDFEATFGKDLPWTEDDEVLLMAKKAEKAPVRPRIYSVCGKQDYLLDYNRRYAAEMEKLDFDFHYEEWDGTHDWPFFEQGLERALRFFARGNAGPPMAP